MKYFVPPLQALLWAFIAFTAAQLTPGLAMGLSFGSALTMALVALGLSLDVIALTFFFKRKTSINPISLAGTATLVTDGPYRYSRNPMYLGMLCYLLALMYWLGNPIAAIAPLGFVMLMNRTQIAREEAMLRATFGQEYSQYCSRVRRWV